MLNPLTRKKQLFSLFNSYPKSRNASFSVKPSLDTAITRHKKSIFYFGNELYRINPFWETRGTKRYYLTQEVILFKKDFELLGNLIDLYVCRIYPEVYCKVNAL